MEHGNPTAYAAHRKAGEKPCDACRLDANARSKASREKKKEDRATKLGVVAEAKPPKLKTLRDYADALKPADLSVYTHQVVLADGSSFSIHKSAEDAARARDSLKNNATVEPYVPNPTQYWNTGEKRYDH